MKDLINCGFMLGSSIAVTCSILKIVKQKELKGVSHVANFFFCGFSYWNIYYYSSLSQPFSAVTGILTATVNTIYVSLAFYYSQRPNYLKGD